MSKQQFTITDNGRRFLICSATLELRKAILIPSSLVYIQGTKAWYRCPSCGGVHRTEADKVRQGGQQRTACLHPGAVRMVDFSLTNDSVYEANESSAHTFAAQQRMKVDNRTYLRLEKQFGMINRDWNGVRQGNKDSFRALVPYDYSGMVVTPIISRFAAANLLDILPESGFYDPLQVNQKLTALGLVFDKSNPWFSVHDIDRVIGRRPKKFKLFSAEQLPETVIPY